jgi:hypothetical protein
VDFERLKKLTTALRQMQAGTLDQDLREPQSRGLVDDIEEKALVNFTTRWIGLIMTATLLSGGVAAQDFALPDPDGLDLPDNSILGPSYDDDAPMGSVESIPPSPTTMPRSAPTGMNGPDAMGPSRLVGETQMLSAPYDEGLPHEGVQPVGDPWQEWGPDAHPYSDWHGEPAIPESSGTWLNRGVWHLEAEAVAYYRIWNRHDIIIAAQDQNVESPAFFPALLQSNRVLWLTKSHPGNDVAVRTTLGRFLFRDENNRDHVGEFTVFGGGDWVQDNTITSSVPNGLFTPYHVAGSQNRDFDLSSAQRFMYSSRYNSFEANYRVKQRLGRDQMVMDPNGQWRRAANSGWHRDFLAGLRYFEFNELVDWRAEDIVTTGTDGRYIVTTRNDLFGAQVGGGIAYETGRWDVGVRSKIGLFLNDADAHSQLTFTDGLENFNRSTTEQELSFLTEVNLIGRWHLTPGFSLRAGLDLLFFESVAMAPHQINFLPVYSQITATGDPVYMGGSLGFECYW